MSDKLYEVEITGKMYVLAEDDEEAVETACRSMSSHDSEECGLTICEPELVKAGHEVPETWKTGLPFSKHTPDKEKTVQALVNEMGDRHFEVTLTVKAHLLAASKDKAQEHVICNLGSLENAVSSMEATAHAEETD